MNRPNTPSHYTISEVITTTLDSGEEITGTLWLEPSRRGSFEVEYRGIHKSDGRRNYTSEGPMRAVARIILRELAQDHPH